MREKMEGLDGTMNSKILLVGDPAVGKSSLLCGFIRCMEDQNKKKENKLPSFVDSYNRTEGIILKSVTMNHIEGSKVELQIWDTAGVDCANIISTSCFERAHGIMIVYDVTKMESFKNAKEWLSHSARCSNDFVCKLLVGNKCDLVENKEVDTEIAGGFAGQLGIPFVETSAKSSIHVNVPFNIIAVEIKKRWRDHPCSLSFPPRVLSCSPDTIVIPPSEILKFLVERDEHRRGTSDLQLYTEEVDADFYDMDIKKMMEGYNQRCFCWNKKPGDREGKKLQKKTKGFLSYWDHTGHGHFHGVKDFYWDEFEFRRVYAEIVSGVCVIQEKIRIAMFNLVTYQETGLL